MDPGNPGSKCHLLTGAHGLPLHLLISAANTHDSRLVEPPWATTPVCASVEVLGPAPTARGEMHADKGFWSPQVAPLPPKMQDQGAHHPARGRGQESPRPTPLGRGSRSFLDAAFPALRNLLQPPQDTLLPLLLLAVTLIHVRRLHQTSEL